VYQPRFRTYFFELLVITSLIWVSWPAVMTRKLDPAQGCLKASHACSKRLVSDFAHPINPYVDLRFIDTCDTWQTNAMAPEPKVSSPCSQKPAIGPYPTPIESTPPLQPISLRSSLMQSTPPSSEWSLSFGLSHQNLVHSSLLSHA
jgi:hypothetical protein